MLRLTTLPGPGPRELVDANPFDRILGIGFVANGAGDKRNRWGMNFLGKCLMELREEFRREVEAAGVEGGIVGTNDYE
ncbi:hypothetical protein F4801DRAFT_584830 [Xylaria longipes]|nr:hypothetical protein F4801DRAFT_584830 [Xylaria longipes]